VLHLSASRISSNWSLHDQCMDSCRPMQWNRQRTNFREFNFSARPLPVWKCCSWHCTVLARFSLSSKTVDGRATLFQRTFVRKST